MTDEPRTTKEKPFSYSKMLARYTLATKYCKGKILDIGCGYGFQCKLFDDYFGIDSYGPCIVKAYTDYPKDKKFLRMKVPPIMFQNSSFDAVICCEMIEHLTEPNAKHLLYEINRILRKDGILFLTTPNANNKNPETHHIKEYTPVELKFLLADAKFKIIHKQGLSFSFNKHCPFWLKKLPRTRKLIGKVVDLTIRNLLIKHNSSKSEHQVVVCKK